MVPMMKNAYTEFVAEGHRDFSTETMAPVTWRPIADAQVRSDGGSDE